MRRHIVLWALLLVFSLQVQGNVAVSRAADPGDEFWSSDFYPAGVSGSLLSMLSQSEGVYAGGSFSAITDVAVRNIARLEMSGGVITQVVPLGEGLTGQVRALCEHDGDIIAAGDFNKSGTTILNGVGRWDGTAWLPLGDGLAGVWPSAAASFQGQVFAGAYRWNGASWKNLFQTDGRVTTLVVHDGLLYVGGSFTEAQGQPHSNVFAWDGAQILPLGAGFPYPVYSAAAGTPGVVFSGNDDTDLGQVSRWDGAAWTTELANSMSFDIAYHGDDLVVSTWTYFGSSMLVPRLETNKGGTWHGIGNFLAGPMVEHDGMLLVKANAGAVPGLLTPGLIGYDGVGLQSVFPPANGFSRGFGSLAEMGGALLVSGGFVIADGREFDGAAVVSGGTWLRRGDRADLNTNLPGSFVDLATVGWDVFGVYIIYDYDISETILTKLNWEFDPPRWQQVNLGNGFGGSLRTVGTQLYNVAYGVLNEIDLATGDVILVAALDLNGTIEGTCDYLGTLTMCGSFSTNFGQPISNVTRYVNGVWEDVGNPLPGLSVVAVAPMDASRLAAATSVGSGVYRVSVFDGVSWSALPGDFNGGVTRLLFHRGRLFAAGGFNRVGLVSAAGIAIWTGDQWAPVGSGLDGRASNMITVGDDLFLTGRFYTTGGRPSVGFAQWTGDPTLFTGAPSHVPDDTPPTARLLGDVYPNPFNPRTEVAFVVPRSGRIRIGIFDVRGNRVRELVNGNFETGSYSRTWNGLDDSGQALPSGVYFAQMLTSDRMESVKLTLVR